MVSLWKNNFPYGFLEGDVSVILFFPPPVSGHRKNECSLPLNEIPCFQNNFFCSSSIAILRFVQSSSVF